MGHSLRLLEKRVVLAHKHDLLLQPIYPRKFTEDITQRLTTLGVELLLQHMVLNVPNLAAELQTKDQVTVTTHKELGIEGMDLTMCVFGEWPRNTE